MIQYQTVFQLKFGAGNDTEWSIKNGRSRFVHVEWSSELDVTNDLRIGRMECTNNESGCATVKKITSVVEVSKCSVGMIFFRLGDFLNEDFEAYPSQTQGVFHHVGAKDLRLAVLAHNPCIPIKHQTP